MVLAWLRSRRRSKITGQPFPADWEQAVARNVPQFTQLTPDEQARLRRWIQVFVAEKNWEGCNGLDLTDEIRATIAAHAGRLVLGFRDDYFDWLTTILVYPSDFLVEGEHRRPDGTMTDEASLRLGEAWRQDTVVLSWPSVLAAGGPRCRQNVVLHEFAHVLDARDAYLDGMPPLSTREQHRAWREVMDAEYNLLVRRAEQGRPTLIDQYGTLNPAEFFAVSTECFFERPVELSERHERLYQLLRDFYRQDPAARLLALSGAHAGNGDGAS